MKANLILSIDRRNNHETALQVLHLTQKYHHKGVVGVDLCGDPAHSNISEPLSILSQAKALGIKTTIHFAEAPQTSSAKELFELLDLGPERLGHVINVPDEVKKEIVRRKLGLELCLSCNVHAKMITGTYGDHHFGYWRGSGCPISLSVRSISNLAVILCTSFFSS